MQLLNTPDLKTVSWTPPASSADIHFKENLDGEIDSAGAVTHQDVAAISGLTADFVSLAESVLTLAGSEETHRPDQDGDGKASLNLAKLRELKADAERTLERSAMTLGASAEPSNKLNLIDGSLEMRLVFLGVELSKVIDEVLKGRFQAQKDRNTEIQDLNELTNALRKLQKYKEDFTAADLEKTFKSFQPDSLLFKPIIEGARRRMWHRIDSHPIFDSAEEWLSFRENEFEQFEHFCVSGKAGLSDLLYGYGIYNAEEKLPATKEELEAATEKISSMVSSINSTQTLKMLDIDKFTNGRNEAFNLAVKVNNSKVDNLNAIIRQIGERQ